MPWRACSLWNWSYDADNVWSHGRNTIMHDNVWWWHCTIMYHDMCWCHRARWCVVIPLVEKTTERLEDNQLSIIFQSRDNTLRWLITLPVPPNICRSLAKPWRACSYYQHYDVWCDNSIILIHTMMCGVMIPSCTMIWGGACSISLSIVINYDVAQR